MDVSLLFHGLYCILRVVEKRTSKQNYFMLSGKTQVTKEKEISVLLNT